MTIMLNRDENERGKATRGRLEITQKVELHIFIIICLSSRIQIESGWFWTQCNSRLGKPSFVITKQITTTSTTTANVKGQSKDFLFSLSFSRRTLNTRPRQQNQQQNET